MSDFNPRAYMEAQSESDSAGSDSKLDGLTLTVLAAMALAGGLFGYNTVMDFRGKNQAKLGQMMAEAEIKDQERAAQQKANIGGISLMANYASNMGASQKMANDVFSQIQHNENLKNIDLPKGDISDAKAFLAYPKTNAGEYAKYTSTQAMIRRCQYDGYSKTRLQNYRRQNAQQIDSIKGAYAPTEKLEFSRNGVPKSMQHIKTEKDAMKFVLNGGAQKHMSQSMGMMSAMGGEPGVSGDLLKQVVAIGNKKAKTRRDYRGWSSEACNYLNNAIASGKLNVRRRKT